MQLWVFVEPNDDTLSNDGADEDDEVGRLVTTMEKDMKVNAAVGKGVVMGLAVAVTRVSEDGLEMLSDAHHAV